MSREIIESIFARCVEIGDCKIWKGAYTDSGMPAMYVPGKKGLRKVRPILYAAQHGAVPPGKVISPSCGEKGCLCHLEAVTKSQSALWAAQRGALGRPAQIRKGAMTKRAQSWITEEMVARIKAAPNGKVAAELTGVSHSHAKNIRRGTARADFGNPFGGLMAANEKLVARV